MTPLTITESINWCDENNNKIFKNMEFVIPSHQDQLDKAELWRLGKVTWEELENEVEVIVNGKHYKKSDLMKHSVRR